MNKQDLLAYYQAQKVDRERMYTKPFRRYQQRRRLEAIRRVAGEAYGQAKGARVLDVGCGDGYGSSVVLEGLDYALFVGLDLSPEKLDTARQGLRASRVVLGDAEGLPFSDEAFDLAYSLETLEHLMDPGKALAEIARVLRPGGTLFLSVPVSSGINAAISRRLMRSRPGGKFREHLQVYTTKRMLGLLRQTGLWPRNHRFCVFNYPCYEILTRLIPYRLWRRLDEGLSRWPLGFVGAKYGFSFGLGNDYLVVRAEKSPAGETSDPQAT
ncbi:class I SAM-dependent methyltransferase [bacterium]|nr:class I SAM-dependent methyltransferase [bacterium]